MQSSSNYDYHYPANKVSHHHAYLLPPLQALLPHSPSQILDLGCGDGRLSHHLASWGHQVVGMDQSTSGIAIAQAQYPQQQFIQASLYEAVPQFEYQFDVVVAVEVIEHLLYPRELLRMAKYYLKPGGLLIVTTPYHGYLKNLAIALTNHWDQHWNPLWDGGHVKFFSVNTLEKLLQEEGWQDAEFRFAGRMPLLWKSMLCAVRRPN